MKTISLKDYSSLEEALRLVNTGDVIVLCVGAYDEWKTDLFGIITRQGNRFLRNGSNLIRECECTLDDDGQGHRVCACSCGGWYPSISGDVIFKQNHQCLRYTAGYREVLQAIHGCTYQQESTVATKIVFDNGFVCGEMDDCAPNLRGLVIKRDNTFLLRDWKGGLNYLCTSFGNDWRPSPRGVFTRRDGDDRFFCSGEYHGQNEELFCRGEPCDWDAGFSELVFMRGQRVLRVSRNGEKLIYEGEFEAQKAHPNGVVIVIGNEFRLVVYKNDEK